MELAGWYRFVKVLRACPESKHVKSLRTQELAFLPDNTSLGYDPTQLGFASEKNETIYRMSQNSSLSTSSSRQVHLFISFIMRSLLITCSMLFMRNHPRFCETKSQHIVPGSENRNNNTEIASLIDTV